MTHKMTQEEWQKSIVWVGVIAGCVIKKDDKFLLVQEKQEKVYGKWNLPAGHVDVGETIEQAAIREAKEETGFEVELNGELRIEHYSADRPVLHSFKATIVGGSLKFQEDELLDARWFTLEEVEKLYSEGKIRADWVVHSIQDFENS